MTQKYTSVSESTPTILAKMVYTDRPFFSIKMASVSKQSGSSDCGLFAIAYKTHTAYGLDPSLCFGPRSNAQTSHSMF